MGLDGGGVCLQKGVRCGWVGGWSRRRNRCARGSAASGRTGLLHVPARGGPHAGLRDATHPPPNNVRPRPARRRPTLLYRHPHRNRTAGPHHNQPPSLRPHNLNSPIASCSTYLRKHSSRKSHTFQWWNTIYEWLWW